ncbi:MAG: twin-arginine translocase subunit TatC [Deltaproteobacteria bacterium]|nr:MAG: twin-arginine translocase subunit TatC [Deltaproteobacteria bacterium]
MGVKGKAGSGGNADEQEKVSFTEHLEDLRATVIKSFLAMLAGFILCYIYSRELYGFLIIPLNEAMPKGGQVAMISVTEGFITFLKVSLLGGVMVASPVIFYQIWKFIAPGLYAHEKRYVWPFVFSATLFFLLGASFAYFVVFPFGLKFLLEFPGPEVNPTISMGQYLSFTTKLMLAFGAIFELPVAVFFMSRMGLIHYSTLAKGRGIALVVIFIVAAVLTPPDVFTQFLMACPLYILYEISIWVARIFGTADQLEEDAREEATE